MKHFRIGDDCVQFVEMESKRGRDDYTLPGRDRQQHAQYLQSRYEQVKSSSMNDRLQVGIPEDLLAKGVYMEMSVENSVDLNSLDSSRGAKLRNIKENKAEKNLDVTLFVPDKYGNWLEKKIDDYKDETKYSQKGKPINQRLIDSINSISSTSVIQLLTQREDREKYDRMPSDMFSSYELWLMQDGNQWDENSFSQKMAALDIIYHAHQYVQFANTIIVLVQAAKRQLTGLTMVLDGLSEIRLFHSASVLTACPFSERDEWAQLIRQNTVNSEHMQRVGVLDSGVCNHHDLLLPYLPDNRLHNATLSRYDTDRVRRGHGTLMAGMALYGDLTDAVNQTTPIEVNADLTSVKIYTDPSEEDMNQDEEDKASRDAFYAVIAEDGILQARNDHANILCSAITTSDTCHGDPSAWSSAIDQTLFNQGAANEVMFLAAGNIENTQGLPYPNFNYITELKDPAQSWNAVSVGAYTRKVTISDRNYVGRQPIAPLDGLSPYSPTSLQWSNELIKPEILMEGGNALLEKDGSLTAAPDELNLVSTSKNQNNSPFEAFFATSAASAMAANLAAKIASANPNLSPLSVRALMIHSAEWTDEMLNMCKINGKVDYKLLLHACGYGVPNEAKAIASDNTYATFIAEQNLQCLVQSTDHKYKVNWMHIYAMPWPKEILESMQDEEVTLKITLSYYVEPAPGSKTRLSKYQYPSMSLRFDVNMPTESLAQFQRRVSNIEMEGVEKQSNNSNRWTIGINTRNHGCVMSDSIRTTAADIASCRFISVSPKYGWWRNMRYTADKGIPYSLVVSIETAKTNICNYIAQPVQVEV